MPPVFGLQAIRGRELPLRLQHQFGESALGEGLDDAHAEMRRGAVERIERDESLERLRRVVVPQLGQVVLAEVAVDAVLVGATPEAGEVLPDGLRPAEVAEAQADDSKGIGDAALVFLFVRLIEAVTDRHLVVEQRHVLLQGLFVQILLVERPPELVEAEFVVRRAGAQAGDRRIGSLGIAIFSAGEEVLAPPELHFGGMLGMWIRPDQALHGGHGLFGPAQLLVRPRHLIEDLVAVLVTWIVLEQPFIEGDRLERTRRIHVNAHRVRGRGAGVAARPSPAVRGRALLEILIGFPRGGAGDRRGRMGRAGLRARGCLCEQRGGQLPRPAVARAYTELLLDLQVRETAHRLRSHRGLRCLLEEAPVALHGLIEALLDRHLLQVRGHLAQIRQRRLRPCVKPGAADDDGRRQQHRKGEAPHQCPSVSCPARAARS